MSARKQVYVVDDEEVIRRSLGMMLKLAKWDATTFESGVHLLDQIDDLPNACILLDVRMPGMDGLEVQRQLNSRASACPTVVMTGHGEVSVAVAALRGGAVDFLEKPFEKSKLLAALERAWLKLSDPQGYGAIRHDAASTLAGLSRFEHDVLRSFAEGSANQATAAALGCPLAEVELARANLIKKLGGSNLSDAIRVAFLADGYL
jgi:two-component system response regulator FixJ